MKKSLSTLLSVAMSVSMFASVAFGAEATLDTQAKYDALHEKGIFEGVDGNVPGLDQKMTRAQYAKVLSLVFELPQATGSSYTDLDGAGWAAGYIEAVTKAGLMDGVWDGIFDPSGNVTLEQLATVLARGFDLQQTTDGVSGTVSDWAKGYVGAALKAGLISAKSDYTQPALRSDLVESTYAAYQLYQQQNQKETTAEYSAVGAKKLQVKFNNAVDDTKVTFDVKFFTSPATVSKVTWSDDKKTATLEMGSKLIKGDYNITVKGAAANDLTGKVTVEDEKVSKIDIPSDTAAMLQDNTGKPTGAQIGYRVYNQYNEDITEVAGTPSITWNSSIGTVNSDNKGKLTITFPDGVTVWKDQAFSISGYIQDVNNSATINKTVKLGDRAAVSTLNVTSVYSASGKDLNTDFTNGTYYLLLDAKDQYGNKVKANDFKDGMLVYSTNPSVLQIDVADVTDNAGPNGDQLGIPLKRGTNIEAFLNNGENDLEVPVSFLSKYGGVSTQYTVKIQKAGIVDTFTLTNPATVVAAGDTIKIPFVAVDQYGNSITKYDDLEKVKVYVNGNPLSWKKNYSDNTGYLEYPVPESAANNSTIMLTAYTPTNKFSQLMLTVRETKKASEISSASFRNGMVAGAAVEVKGDSFKALDQYGSNMTIDNVNFYNKYNIKFTLSSSLANAGVKFVNTANTPAQSDTVAVFTQTGDKLNIVGGTAAASGNITAVITDKAGNEIAGSSKELSFKVVNIDDVKQFAVGDIGKLFDTAAANSEYHVSYTATDYNQDVDVYGTLSDGSAVSIPASNVTVTGGTYGLVSTPASGASKAKVRAEGTRFPSNSTEYKGTVSVAVRGKDDSTVISKEVTISKELPVAQSVSYASQNSGSYYHIKLESGNYFKASASALTGSLTGSSQILKKDYAVKFVDQYGKKLDPSSAYVTINKTATDGTTSQVYSGTVSGASLNPQAGEVYEFIVSFGNTTAQFKVEVVNDSKYN